MLGGKVWRRRSDGGPEPSGGMERVGRFDLEPKFAEDEEGKGSRQASVGEGHSFPGECKCICSGERSRICSGGCSCICSGDVSGGSDPDGRLSDDPFVYASYGWCEVDGDGYVGRLSAVAGPRMGPSAMLDGNGCCRRSSPPRSCEPFP